MAENGILGMAQDEFGAAERKLGETLGSDHLQMDGAENQVKGAARKVAGKLKAGIDQAADSVAAGVNRAGETARDAYGQARQRVQKVQASVDPFIQERPYQALGIGLAAGVVIGMLLTRGGGPKIIYVKPRD